MRAEMSRQRPRERQRDCSVAEQRVHMLPPPGQESHWFGCRSLIESRLAVKEKERKKGKKCCSGLPDSSQGPDGRLGEGSPPFRCSVFAADVRFGSERSTSRAAPSPRAWS